MASWLPRRGLHRAALSSCAVMQPAPRDVERLADSHMRVLPFGIELGFFRGLLRIDAVRRRVKAGFVRHDDVLSRHGEVDSDVIAVAGLMMTLCELDQYATAGDGEVVRLELVHPRADLRFEGGGRRDATERNDWCGLHVNSPAASSSCLICECGLAASTRDFVNCGVTETDH